MPDINNSHIENEVAVAVQKVIDQRKSTHLVKIKEKKDFYEGLLTKVIEFETFRQDSILAQEQAKSGPYYSYFKSDPTLIDRVINATAADTIEKIKKCISICDHLYTRFNRDTLNISVIGRARQGKSCLLQMISGLSNEVIPAADGGDCTGTTSMIQNNNEIVETYAEIKFFSQEEMVEIVKSYLKQIGLNNPVPSFESIPALKYLIDEYKKTLKNQFNAKQQSLFKHLSKYITHFHEVSDQGKTIEGYARYVLEESKTVTEAEIREYVAQYDLSNNPVYKYLAVKEVLIHTRFTVPQVGNIVLVDTIGLGDTSLGIEEKMLKTLRENSDAAFLVRFPAQTGDNWKTEDNDLHILIESAMGRQMLDKWLYLVINKIADGSNHNSSKALIQSISDLDLHFAEIIQVNCKSPEEVYNKLLLPSLHHLSEKLIEVDNNLLEEANKTFNECYMSYLKLHNAAKSILIDSPANQGTLTSFGLKKWEELEPEITRALGRLSKYYESEYDYPNTDSFDALDATRINIRYQMPSRLWYKDKLEAMRAQDGPMSVYETGCNYTRARIMTEFSKINCKVLEKLENIFKYKFAHLFFKIGRWREIPLETHENSICSVEWLEAFKKEKLKNKPHLKELIDTILSYRISMSDYLAKGVAQTLNYINPLTPTFIRPNMAIVEEYGIEGLEALADFLYDAMDNPLTEIKGELRDVIKEASLIPNFSLSTRAELVRNKLVMNKEAMNEFRDFYILNSAFFWSEEFKTAAAANQTFGVLSNWIDELHTAKKEKFTIVL